MSDPISPLSGARFDGIAHIEEAGPAGMITLRGDLASKPVKSIAATVTGAKLPAQGQIVFGKTGAVAWMSPDELMLFCAYEAAPAGVELATASFGAAHGLAVDVSDARAKFRISGPAAREVMGKIFPIDFAPGQFEPGRFRRSRMGQIAAAVWMEADGSFGIICFRSVAEYAFALLNESALPGSAVGIY
ncbi:sarcosine oxidase subunit gamma [Pseudodonghicola flavimaris]|uniref:Sarcosine oxidase subunit gamma family protein n=1 Tax=Pseudodonghicola flavimaris TaxID=3050036 RepID=A0ABT7F7Q4_9RHOB|nr:sarcosine oxidase subunit gamma family protein [Pseudodonghicola flavimaris]MDK3020525.1 sarcosine oxidase subunit gamma family protein [Pseudodonghicola flavimaris]